MLDASHHQDSTPPPEAGAFAADHSVQRPLIQDLMPSADRLSTASKTSDQPTRQPLPLSAAGGDVLGGDYLKVPPLSYASAENSDSHKGIARPVDPAESKHSLDAAAGDPFKSHMSELVTSARGQLGHNLTVPPKEAHSPVVPAKFGCAASMFNLMIHKKMATAKDFDPNIDGLEKFLVHKMHAVKVGVNDLRPGDFVVGRDETDGSGGRHVGLVDQGTDGRLMAINNNGGRLVSKPVDQRFSNERYGTVYGWHIP